MPPPSHPPQFALIALAGWFDQQQRDIIDYLQEENRVLREQIRGGPLRFTDDQRRRLAAKARTLGRRLLREFATIVTPDTCWRGTVPSSPSNTTAVGVVVPAGRRSSARSARLIVRMATENRSWGYTR